MPVTIFLCYTQKDEHMAGQLKNHLSSLEHSGLITVWDRGKIMPGFEWEQEIVKQLDKAEIILLLLSASFLSSEYYYNVEMQHAIERHERKEARVIPVILRPVNWNIAPIDKLAPLPERAKPISRWRPQDEGFKNVADSIIKVVDQWNEHALPDPKEERKEMIVNLDRLIETVKSQLQPTPRAEHTASTLEQLSVYIPSDVTLADLIVGWRTLSYPSNQGEEIAIERRRVTCGELANLASQFTNEQGNLTQAIKTWRIWRDVFVNRTDRGDRRQATMANTFSRELAELEEAAATP